MISALSSLSLLGILLLGFGAAFAAIGVFLGAMIAIYLLLDAFDSIFN